MAKLKAPLLSLGASGKLGNALVFFNWKGLDVVREYVVPANPKTTAQVAHRAYLTAAVLAIHTAQGLAAHPLVAADTVAYALWGSVYPTPRTWFNQVVKSWIDQYVAGLHGVIYREMLVSPGNTTMSASAYWTREGTNNITGARLYYGTSKTAMNAYVTCDVGGGFISKQITGLTNGTKYYVQIRPTAHADYVGAYSGIRYGTPST